MMTKEQEEGEGEEEVDEVGEAELDDRRGHDCEVAEQPHSHSDCVEKWE